MGGRRREVRGERKGGRRGRESEREGWGERECLNFWEVMYY